MLCRITLLLLVLAPAAALAGGDGRQPLAEEHVLLASSEVSWSKADLASLRRGARAVPSAIRREVGPLRFERVRRTCPFATGAYSDACPSFDEEDEQTFFVYDASPIHGEGPPSRLSALNASERRDILVRRAVVHAFVAALDRDKGWSEDSGWRSLNAWREATSAFNRNPWGYSRYLGMRSAHLDLVTFAEEYLVRPEDVLRDSQAADAPRRLSALDTDLAVQCQEFSKMRFLAGRIQALDASWRPPEDVDRFPTGCQAFDRWARLDALEGIDLVFAAATADRPQSLWGHLLLHIRHEDAAEGLEPVYQFGAVTDTDVAPLDYLSRGLAGGFYTVFDPNSFRTIDRLILQSQQRSLRRYRLELTEAQTLRVLQRVWEVERRQRLPYWFFDENCAALLVDMLRSALAEVDIPERSDFIVAPSDALDLLAGVQNGPHGPLLRKLPDDVFSNREHARWAEEQRKQALSRILEKLESDGELEDAVVEVAEAVGHNDPDVRRQAYGRLSSLLERAVGRTRNRSEPVAADALTRAAIAYLYYSVRVERYYVEHYLYRARAVIEQARLDSSEYTAEELLARRRELYRHEDIDKRSQQILAREHAQMQDFDNAELRELDADETALLELETRTRRAYQAAIAAQRSLVRQLAPNFDAVGFLEEQQAQFRRQRAAHDARSLGSSGKGRLAIGAASTMVGERVAGGLELDYSFLYERLGSQRRRGFRPDIETRVFGLNLLAPPTADVLEGFDLDLILLRYLTVEQRREAVREGLLDVFGYGFDVRAGHHGWRDVDVEFQGAAGLLYPIWSSDYLADHLVVGVFPAVRWSSGAQRDVELGGLWAMMHAQLHLYGSYANVLRLDAGYTQFMQLDTSELRFEGFGELSTNHALGRVGRRTLIAAPYFRADYTDLSFEEPAQRLRWRGGLRLELPL